VASRAHPWLVRQSQINVHTARNKGERSAERSADIEEMMLASTLIDNNTRQCVFSVPNISCGGCIQRIEKSLLAIAGVTSARVNLTHRRVTIQWRENSAVPPIASRLLSIGYPAHLVKAEQNSNNSQLPYLLRALAVAAFASGNIMLLSVSVWSGADAHTNHLFHWVSAVGTTNMDVPISIGIVLALLLSCYDTLRHSEGVSVYFEAPVMLVFFLLMGRTLDYVMRDKVRKAADGLARLEPAGAWVVDENGGTSYKALAEIVAGDEMAVAADEVIAVDCVVISGKSDLDSSLVSGESEPRAIGEGDQLLAGTHNLTSALRVKVTATASESHLAQMIDLIRAAEQTRTRSRGLADRVSSLYAPVVHTAALLSFIGWFAITRDLHQSITIAIVVLIITCPCALGLAVPMVQVVIARKLFESGILLKNGLALERLAKADTVVLDKTGTLTAGEPRLISAHEVNDKHLEIAATMALSSTHPYCRALRQAFASSHSSELLSPSREVFEVPGCGLEMVEGGHTYRLGKPGWAESGSNSHAAMQMQSTGASQSVLTLDGTLLATFSFEDRLREDAKTSVEKLRAQGLLIECLSGDNNQAVARCAAQLGIGAYKAQQLPADKAAHLESMAEDGKRVLMVGDGLNDAPALAVAYVSMAPGTASEVGRNSADIVFTRNTLASVPDALALARIAARTVRQNLFFALSYNAIALPLAVSGLVTPLFAALAMSASSLIVISNALLINVRVANGKKADVLPEILADAITNGRLADRRNQHA